MTPQQILAKIRKTIHIYSTEQDDAFLYENMTAYYQTLREKLTERDSNYGRARRDTNLNSGQTEYDLKDSVEATSTTPGEFGQLRIERVSIKYNVTDQYPIILQQKDRDTLTYSRERYEDNTPQERPFYIVSGNSVHIFPKPTNTIINGLILEGVKRPYGLNQYTTSKDDILLPKEYHDLLCYGTIIYLARALRREDLSQEYEGFVEREEKRMLINLSMRVTHPVKGNIPMFRTIDSYKKSAY